MRGNPGHLYHHGYDLARQQITQRIDKIAVFVLVKIGKQPLVQRFLIERGLEVDLDTILLAAEMPHMCGRRQD